MEKKLVVIAAIFMGLLVVWFFISGGQKNPEPGVTTTIPNAPQGFSKITPEQDGMDVKASGQVALTAKNNAGSPIFLTGEGATATIDGQTCDLKNSCADVSSNIAKGGSAAERCMILAACLAGNGCGPIPEGGLFSMTIGNCKKTSTGASYSADVKVEYSTKPGASAVMESGTLKGTAS